MFLMRVLQVGNAQTRRFGKARVNVEQKFVNGFIRSGHNVLHFSDRDMAAFLAPFGWRDLGVGKMNKKLLLTAQNFRPDFILLGHCDLVTNKTVELIRAALPDVKIAYRNIDPLFVERNVETIRKRVPYVDAVFITTAGEGLEQFRGKGAAIHHIPNPVDPAIEIFNNSEAESLSYDVFYTGNSTEQTKRREIVEFLREGLTGTDVDFRAFGFGDAPNIWGRDYDDALSKSKMGLNLSRQEGDYLYSSDRLAQLMGNGLLAFVNEATGFQTLFEEECAVFFKDQEDLLEKIIYYKNNDEERKMIARKGRDHYRSHYTSEKITDYMIERTFGGELVGDYRWANY